MPLKKIITIHTLVNGRRHYVTPAYSIRTYDNKILVLYNPDPTRAEDFDSEEEAYEFIPKIVNPHERLFTVDTIEVDVPPVRKIAAQEKGLL